MHKFGRQRASFHGDAFRLTIASSNARVPPLIRPYPPRHHTLLRDMPHSPKVGLYLVISGHEKYIGRAEREILAPVLHRNYLFKAYVDGFPDIY
jgi:hypothetical protein